MKSSQIITTIVLLVVVAIGAFWGGTKYQQKKTISQFGQRNGQNMMGRGAANTTGQVNQGGNGFRQTIGEIISADDKSITIKLTDGSSKIVLFSDTTIINQSVEANKVDLKVGTKVAVMGDQNTDGSVTGRNIEINPRVPTISITPAPTNK